MYTDIFRPQMTLCVYYAKVNIAWDTLKVNLVKISMLFQTTFKWNSLPGLQPCSWLPAETFVQVLEWKFTEYKLKFPPSFSPPYITSKKKKKTPTKYL